MNTEDKMEQGFGQSGMKGLWGLEDKLSSMIEPVTPDPEFIDSLKLKLIHTPVVFLESGKKRVGFLILAAGLVTGAAIVWIINRCRE